MCFYLIFWIFKSFFRALKKQFSQISKREVSFILLILLFNTWTAACRCSRSLEIWIQSEKRRKQVRFLCLGSDCSSMAAGSWPGGIRVHTIWEDEPLSAELFFILCFLYLEKKQISTGVKGGGWAAEREPADDGGWRCDASAATLPPYRKIIKRLWGCCSSSL